MSFKWEQRANELGYSTSRHMLQDLLLKQDLTWEEVKKVVGVDCRHKARKMGIRKQKGPGGAQRTGQSIIDQICDEGVVQRLLELEGSIDGAARKLGVGKETLRRWIRRKDDEAREETEVPSSD